MTDLAERNRHRTLRLRLAHVHWFRWTGYDDFSGASLYSCRCGVARPGI